MSERYLAIRIARDDMAPRIKVDDTVIYDTMTKPAIGDDVLIELDDGRFVARELIDEQNGTWHVKAHARTTLGVLPASRVTAMHPIVAVCPNRYYAEISSEPAELPA